MLRGTRNRGRRSAVLTVVLAAVAALLVTTLSPAGAEHLDEDDEALYLVTLTGPGTAGQRGDLPRSEVVRQMRADQDRLLSAVDAPDPVYRWTTALNGFAVRVDAAQARELGGDPRVTLVEQNTRQRLTSLDRAGAPVAAPGVAPDARGGASTVIGFVDSGIAPDSRAFSDVAALGRPPRFGGGCAPAPAEPSWSPADCGRKIVGAQWYVAGFGADDVRSGESLSPLDTTGHGTQMASIAAGTADVPIRVSGHRLGRSSGVAPRARVASYKACWSAPNPADDGCATADLVAAIDQATADRVDVLNLAVAGSRGIDTVEHALLGATEAGVVVVGAAGNDGDSAYAAHPSPWVISVGATTGDDRVGAVATSGSRRWQGTMASRRSVPRSPLVYGSAAAAPGATTSDARLCRPGSLDAARVSDAVVVCQRGEAARVEKSRAVQRAGGAGMILVNPTRGATHADLHAVPTVHLHRSDAQELRRWARERDRPRVRLRSEGVEQAPTRVAPFSTSGDPTLPLIKPDVVAPGTEVVAATSHGWDLATGTSASAAHVSGAAAVLLARSGSTPERVRSALLGSARPVGDRHGGKAGAGIVTRRGLPDLSFLVPTRRYRAWLAGRWRMLNQPTAMLVDGRSRLRRTLTNTGDEIIDITARTRGFERPVRVYPSYAELAPGDTLTFTVTLDAGAGRDDGIVVWHSDDGRPTRLTVVTAR